MSLLFQPGAVSIGMPVYNGARFLGEALGSLLAQNHPFLELIISDNASTDETPAVCEDWARKDPRIRYFRQPSAVDPLANFNFALRQAGGEFFMWAADDDLWEPGFIQTLRGLLEGGAGSVLAFGGFNNFEFDKDAGATYPRLEELPSPDRFTRLWRFLRQKEREGKANLIYGLMRRQAIEAAGGFKAWGRGSWGADMLTVFRLLAEGNVVLSPDRLFHKRATFPRDAVSAVPDAPGPLDAARGKIRDKLGYLAGYAAIIGGLEGLTSGRRLLLRLEVARQRGYILLREGGQALGSSGKSLARPRRRGGSGARPSR